MTLNWQESVVWKIFDVESIWIFWAKNSKARTFVFWQCSYLLKGLHQNELQNEVKEKNLTREVSISKDGMGKESKGARTEGRRKGVAKKGQLTQAIAQSQSTRSKETIEF